MTDRQIALGIEILRFGPHQCLAEFQGPFTRGACRGQVPGLAVRFAEVILQHTKVPLGGPVVRGFPGECFQQTER
ncbi:MAG: hypothetical protein ACRCZF_18995 [Gemmataceae bacterium]